MSIWRRLRLGFGNRADSYGPEKAWTPGIDFRNGDHIGTIDFNGTDWDVSVDGSPIGKIPGSGGGGGDGGFTANIGFIGGPHLQVGDSMADRSLVNVTLEDWEFDVFPSGDCTVEFKVNGSTISTGGNPSVTGGSNAAGDTTGWASDVVALGDLIEFEITSVSGGVEFVRVWLSGVKS
jgi:hypothetical protein